MMDSAPQETLISIASASRRVIDALFVRAHDRNVRNFNLSHKRLAGDLHRIVAASQTLLTESLEQSSAEPTVDDRLEMWLAGREPKTCLDTLQEMETLIRTDSSSVASTLRNIFLSAPVEDGFKQAIRTFEKNKAYFHFLLETNVWNQETAIMGQPKGHSINGHTRQDLVDRGTSSIKRPWKKKIWSKADRTQLKEILGWLDAWDSTEKHEDTLELRQKGTCTWLLDTDEYQRWRYANDAFLWLHGKPGSGKSVLAASVIDDIQNDTVTEGETLAFFYCDFRSERSTVAAEVMRSLLSQLLQGLCDLAVDPRNILGALDEEKRQRRPILSKSKRLAVLASRVAKQCPYQPLVVVDALDECEDIGNILDSLLYLNKGGVRLLVISRPLQVIKSTFSGLPSLSLEEKEGKVDADIELHVRKEVDSHIWLRDAETTLKEEITWTLFRWIECQLDTLKGCFTPSKIRNVLHSLPAGLDETYQRILLAISKEDQGDEIAKRALMWIVTVFEPLTLRQIVEALSIDLDLRTLNPDSAPIHGRVLLHSLSSLVIHSEETDTVKLSHFSVKEYLVGNFVQANHAAYRINLRDAHAQVAQQYMGYIAACLTQRMQDSNDHPLLDYVLRHGLHHLSNVEPTDQILDSIMALHRDVQRHPLEWELLLKVVQDNGWPSLQHDFVLYVLIRYTPDPLLRQFLCRSPVAEKKGINPLIYAVSRNIEKARMLLEHGAKLGFSGRFIDSKYHEPSSGLPIEAAVRANDSQLVDLFLEEGSPVPHQLFSARLLRNGDYCDESWTEVHILTRLLQTDEFTEWAIDILNKRLLTPALHGLAELVWQPEYSDVVAVMARGVELRLNQIGCDRAGQAFVKTLLQEAMTLGGTFGIQDLLTGLKMQLPPDILLHKSHKGSMHRDMYLDTEMIRFLIRNGANFRDIVSADESTALHYAVNEELDTPLALENCLKRTKLLCEIGCSPTMCNLKGETPMHVAAAAACRFRKNPGESRGDPSVVWHLLSVGTFLPQDILFATHADSYHSALSPSMIRFLLEEGADFKILAANGDSALHSVLRSGCEDNSAVCLLESVRMLVAAGCDLHITNSSGQTSLDIATARGHVSVVKYLLSLNIPLQLPPDILLSVCREIRSYRADALVVVRLLLEHGADPNVSTSYGCNALHLVTESSDAQWRSPGDDWQFRFEVVKILVEAGCDPFACNLRGKTVLHNAIASQSTKIMEYLFWLGALVPPDILLSYPISCRSNTQEIQFLIDKGADVRAVDAHGDTPLHYAVLYSDSESSSLKSAELLIAAGSDPCAFNAAHETPIHHAARRRHISVINYLLSLKVPPLPDILLAALECPRTSNITTVVRFLIDKGADITAVTDEGDTALHLALCRGVGSGSFELVKILVEAGSDIHACNSGGSTPIDFVVPSPDSQRPQWDIRLDIIEYLLSRGASLPPSILLVAVECGDIYIIKYLLSRGASLPPDILLVAAKSGNIEIMEYLVSQGTSVPPGVFLAVASSKLGFSRRVQSIWFLSTLDGADIHAVTPNGDTVLHCALWGQHWMDGGCLSLVELLIHMGCHPSLHNTAGETPLHIAARRHNISVLKYLLSQGVPLPSDVLLSAVSETYFDSDASAMIRLLIREGADPCVVNDKGDTPLHLLLRRSFYEMWEWKMVQMLLDAGANPYARNLDGQTPVDIAEKQGPFFAKNLMRLIKGKWVNRTTM